MAGKNVVREDVVQVGFEVEKMPFQDIVNEINQLKSAVTGGVDSVQEFANEMKQASKGVTDTVKNATAGFDEITEGCNGTSKAVSFINNSIKQFDGGMDKAKTKAADFVTKLKEIASSGVEKITHPIKTISTALGSAKKAGSDFVTKLKDIGKTNISNAQKNIKSIISSLTQGKTGAAGFVTALKNVGKISVTGAVNGIKNIASHAKNGTENLKKLSNTKMNNLKGDLDGVADRLKTIEEKAKSAAAKIGKITLKGLGVAALAGATAVTATVGQSVAAYADYEQLVGGVETLFKDSAGTVMQNANRAFETAGLSANDYMETVTGFSASLLQSVGNDTAKAASMANTALIDMSDNANKMGTDMQSIQYAYQGFAKQNYTMLDNLKLGYGGTQEEMKRLLKDAEKLTGQKYDISSFADITQAIHAIQTQMDITGTTAKEASTTISGSLNSMKAAWSNTLVALVTGGDNFDSCIDDLKSTVLTFIGNIMPAIEGALSGIGHLIEGLAPIIEQEFPKLVDTLLPPLIQATVSLIKGLIKALPNIIKIIIEQLPSIVKQLGEAFIDAFGMKIPILEKFGSFFVENANAIAKSLPYLLGFIGALVAIKTVTSKLGAVSQLFGKSSKNDPISGIMSPFSSLAKAKPTTILKGIANLAIIIGGITAIAAGVMALAPYIAKLSDIKSFMKLIAVIGVLGLVGSALAALAGLVGNIPVSSVALGLANIAIIVAGMSALYLLIGAVSLINFDLKRIMQIAEILAVLGTVGAALSVFAGIVGMIPIPVVLLGLANMALVITGVSAIIVAFGALSEIPHFNEFITKGGATLANLFNQIGNIVGSLIGGFGEGVTSSLPAIGENLSAFAASIQPLISTLGGADVSGIGSFFSAIGGFMLQMAGNDILSIFTGGADLVGLGGQLTAFANSAEGFFTKVASFPENGFSNATALFQSLADIGNVPNTGGIAQWFSGTNDFEALAAGLVQLSSDGVIGFFNKMSGLSPECFDHAQKLFQSLSDIGNIPNTGGIAQWFSGTNDFAGLTQNLPPFGEAMASFYNSISVISDFKKISQLFEALHGIGEAFPNTGGIAQWFSGENDISGVGSKLKQFGLDTKDFFKQVTSLNVGNLNGLWESVKKAGEVAATDLSNLAGKGTELTNFMNNAKGFFTGANEVTAQLDAVNSVATALQNFFNVISGIVNTSLTDINSGLQTTVTLVTTSVNSFNALGVVIVTSTQMGAAAFVLLQTSAQTSLQNIVTVISVTTNKIQNTATTTTQTILSIERNGISTFNSNLSSGLSTAVSTVRSASSQIQSEVSKIKNAFNFSWSLPSIKLPHFKVNGSFSLNPPSVPSFGVDWYAKGGIMTQPTMFGINNGRAMVGGEAGPEAILPLDKFWNNLKQYTEENQIFNNTNTSNSYETVNRSNSHTEYNTYSPQFHLTITGSDDDRALKRKVKNWVKEGMNEAFESMMRRTESIQET